MFAIKTKRLMLRDLLEEDWQAMHKLRSDPVVTKFIDYIKSETEAETRQWLCNTRGHNARKPRLSYNLTIVRQEDEQVIGWIGMGQPSHSTHGDLDFGYALLPAYWGRGYMAEALQALLDYAFEQLGATQSFGECDAANVASARVMEKVGLHLEPRAQNVQGATEEPTGEDELRYIITREEWRQRKAS